MSQSGTVKLFNSIKGFGFITATDGTEIFLHIKGIADGATPQAGDAVMFDQEESKIKPGQMQAVNVTGGTGAGQGGGSTKGTCKSFNVEKGFGFIVGADGSDIFFHMKGVVDGMTPQAGDALNFDLQPSTMKPGEMQAHNIAGGSSKGGGKGKDAGGYGAAKGGWGGGDSWGAPAKGGWGGDSWGASPYGGKGGDSWGGGKGGGDSWGGAKGGDSWGKGGGKGDSWGKGGGDSWGKGGGKGDSWGGAKGGW